MDIPNDDLLDQYEYDKAPALTFLREQDIKDMRAMISFGRDTNKFGLRMTAHQNRVAIEGAKLLGFLDYSAQAQVNYKAAMRFHDIGKIHELYNPAIWLLEDRPTPEQKSLQKRHARLGAEMFEAAHSGLKDHPHYQIRHAVTLLHHERLDGNGPEKRDVSTLPAFVRISCIVDAYDGDRIKRPHQPSRRTPREALRRMANLDGHDKYTGAFDKDLLHAYIKMKEKELNSAIL